MPSRIAEIGLGIFSVLMVLSGVAGIVVGGTSAAAGWWLVVVGSALSGAVTVYGRRAA